MGIERESFMTPPRFAVFICHAREDNERCASLLAALKSWGVLYFFEAEGVVSGQTLAQRTQRAIIESPIFLRICSGEAQRSYWVSLETGAFLSLKADEYRAGRPDAHRLVNLIIDKRYLREPFDTGTVVISTVDTPREQWVNELRAALGLPPLPNAGQTPITFRAPGQGLSRRALLGGVAGTAALAVAGTAGVLALTHRTQTRGNTPPIVRASPTATRQPIQHGPPGTLRWKFATGDKIVATAALAGGLVYITSFDAKVYAVDLLTGKQIWSFKTNATALYASPVVANGSVYLGEHLDGGLGDLYALDAKTGEKLWQKGSAFNIATPLLANGTLYVPTYTIELQLVAPVEAESGNELPYNGPDELGINTPRLVDNVLYVGSRDRYSHPTDGYLYALDAKNQLKQMWRVHTGPTGTSSPAVANGLVYIGALDGTLFAIDIATHAVRWTFKAKGAIESSPLAQGDAIYVGSDDGSVYAVDAASGAKRWAYKTGAGVSSSPVLAGSVLYIGSQDGSVYALDPQHGTLVRKYKTGGPVYSTPTVADGVLYVGSYDKNLYAYDV